MVLHNIIFYAFFSNTKSNNTKFWTFVIFIDFAPALSVHGRQPGPTPDQHLSQLLRAVPDHQPARGEPRQFFTPASRPVPVLMVPDVLGRGQLLQQQQREQEEQRQRRACKDVAPQAARGQFRHGGGTSRISCELQLVAE